jgi:hypothetical protein
MPSSSRPFSASDDIRPLVILPKSFRQLGSIPKKPYEIDEKFTDSVSDSGSNGDLIDAPRRCDRPLVTRAARAG